jgi:pterin-4a-carbinolamine dehydratase
MDTLTSQQVTAELGTTPGWDVTDGQLTWNKVTLQLVTHSAGGLTAKDFALARQISDLG